MPCFCSCVCVFGYLESKGGKQRRGVYSVCLCVSWSFVVSYAPLSLSFYLLWVFDMFYISFVFFCLWVCVSLSVYIYFVRSFVVCCLSVCLGLCFMLCFVACGRCLLYIKTPPFYWVAFGSACGGLCVLYYYGFDYIACVVHISNIFYHYIFFNVGVSLQVLKVSGAILAGGYFSDACNSAIFYSMGFSFVSLFVWVFHLFYIINI